MAQLCIWTKICIKQWLVLGAPAFQCMRADFLCLKYENFACLHPPKIKMNFIWKYEFFFAKIGIFCKSIAGPISSVVQAYIQPYSFGGRIKLIICQIRRELSVTIHEISTSWKKTLDVGPYICFRIHLRNYFIFSIYFYFFYFLKDVKHQIYSNIWYYFSNSISYSFYLKICFIELVNHIFIPRFKLSWITIIYLLQNVVYKSIRTLDKNVKVRRLLKIFYSCFYCNFNSFRNNKNT